MSAPFTCPVCARPSFNPNDAANRYCGHCHEFFPQPGKVCLYCGEYIAADDLPAKHELQMHYECSIRTIAGSVNHQQKKCSCFDPNRVGPCEDAALSLRDNARLACQEWHHGHP